MKKFLSLFAAFLFLGVTQMWGENLTKTEGFETKAASTTYNSTVTISEDESDCGIGWSIYYGTVSTNDKISGNNSAQMRYYASSDNRGYVQSTTAIEGLSNVAFKARVSSLDMKLTVSYSADGSAWTALATNIAFEAAGASGVKTLNYDIPSGGKYIKFEVAEGSTKPSSSNIKLIIDDVVFTYAEQGGDDPQPTTQDLYLKLSSDWAGWPAKYAVYYFNDTENGWSEFMTEVDGEDNTYTTTIPVGYSKVIFVRLDGEATEANWDNKWSQTGNEDIPEGKNHFTVTSGGTGSECGGVWAKYPVVPTYYVKGTFNNWGDGMEMTEGTYTFENLAADTYEIKVVDDANNWYGFEVLDQTKSSANIYNAGGNIKFTLAEAGNVTVAYANSKITVTGTFVAPSTKFTVTVPENTEKAYIAGNFNNWTPTEMTLKAGEEDVFELTVEGVESDTVAYKYLAGADWKFEEVIEDNRSYNAADEVSAWKAVPTIYKYAKVKEAPVNWTGHYILAWEDLKPHSAISGSDFVADANAAAFLAGDTISIMEGNDFAVDIRFSETAGAYTVKLPNGKYLAIPSSNAMSEQEDPFAFSMAYFKGENQEGVQFGNGDLTSTSTRMMYKNNNYFRSYTNKINNASYKLPTLYRLVDEAFDCQDGPYALLVNGTTVIPAKMEAKEGYNEYAMYASLVMGDSVQVLNTSCGGLWIPTLEEAGAADHFAKGLAAATVDSTGCYDFYFKQIPNDQKMYIGFGICADDTIRYTVRGKGGILGEDFEKAIDSKQDTLELALEAGKYELKVIVGADWKGFEQLTDTATGLQVGDQGNICFELNEAGAVSVVYNDSVFKLIGNFYIAPIKYYIAGSMSKWAEEMVELLPLEEKADSLGIAINLEADSLYAFKVVRVQGTDTAWYGLGEAATMEYGNSTGWWLKGQVDVALQTTKAGEYEFIFKANENNEISVVIPEPAKKYYAKYAPKWEWSMLTEKEGMWLTDTIVYGGIGININDQAADENNMFYSNTVEEEGVRPIAGAEIAEKDTIYFSFNPADSVVTAIMVGKYVPQLPVVGLGANFNDWNYGANLLTPAEDSLSASIKVTLGVTDTLKFKIVSDNNWLSLNGEGEDGLYGLHRGWPTAEHINLANDGRNFALNADVAGEYTFTWFYADSTLTITFPEKETRLADGYYLIGSAYNWTVDNVTADLKFEPNPGAEGEYMLSTTVAEDDNIKVVKVENDAAKTWFPEDEQGAYHVDAEHAGPVIIYFRPDYQGAQDWHYNCFTVLKDSSTAIDETVAAGKAAKVLRDGQILIIKGEKIFNVQGQRVK